jgi:hypothetical protein
MGHIRSWIRRLERESRGSLIIIPQQDGTVAKFKPSDLWEAFDSVHRQLCGEERGLALGSIPLAGAGCPYSLLTEKTPSRQFSFLGI